MTKYPNAEEFGDENDVMPGNCKEFADNIIGHKITEVDFSGGRYSGEASFTLDNGKKVTLHATSDCCAGTDVYDLIQKLPTLDHVITAVKPSKDYTVWHIMAGMNEVLELGVSWSAGSGYYMYGFNIEVEEA
jgi:hypothetical protein